MIKKDRFGGTIGPGNSMNLHNFLYRFKTLRVYASFNDAYNLLMRSYQQPPDYFYFFALCNVIPHFAFAFFSNFLIGPFTGVLF